LPDISKDQEIANLFKTIVPKKIRNILLKKTTSIKRKATQDFIHPFEDLDANTTKNKKSNQNLVKHHRSLSRESLSIVKNKRGGVTTIKGKEDLELVSIEVSRNH
jgi:hypothetical protein